MIKCTGDKILVKPIEWESKTKAGLHVVGKQGTHFKLGTILDIGMGRDTLHGYEPITDLAVGDKVMYYTAMGSAFMWEGEDFVMLNYKEVHARISD